MTLANDAVIKRFANGDTAARAGNLFVENDIVYSYGSHFPLVVRLSNKGSCRFVVNADKHSVTTSHHQTIALNNLPHGKTVAIAASAFPFDIMSFLSSGEAVVIDFTEDRFNTGATADKKPPPTNEGWDVSYREDDKFWEAHKPGGALIKNLHTNKYYLCGVDEGSYFCCQLDEPADTIDEAFLNLKPNCVRHSDKDVLRQGELFFIPVDVQTRNLPHPSLRISLEEANRKVNPDDEYSAGDNYHQPREVRLNGNIYCRGRVVHRNNFTQKATGGHLSLLLGETWHEVHRNTAVQSWSSAGQFD